jgi:hypothetical protein
MQQRPLHSGNRSRFGSFLPVFLLVLSLFSGQKKLKADPAADHCKNLLKIIEKAHADSIKSLKYKAVKGQDYFTSSISLTGSYAVIYENKVYKRFEFIELIDPAKNPAVVLKDAAKQNNLLKEDATKIKACLPQSNWELTTHDEEGAAFPYVLRNLKSRVFIGFRYQEGTEIHIYRQAAPDDKCLKGDCRNGLGQMQLENGDMYEGLFHNGFRLGYGAYTAASGAKYNGGWLYDYQEGYGIMFNPDGSEKMKGYVLDGIFFNLDTTKMNVCQLGNCKDGMGAVHFSNGSTYIGNFKGGVQSGPGMFESREGAYYGDFRDGKYNGYGIIYFSNGTYFAGNFVDGFQEGPGLEKTAEGTTIEGTYKSGIFNGSEYNENGVLQRKGSWKGGVFFAGADKSNDVLLSFGKSLNNILSVSGNGFKQIRGEKQADSVYASKAYLVGCSNTVITYKNGKPLVIATSEPPAEKGSQALLNSYDVWVKVLGSVLDKSWKAGEIEHTDLAKAGPKRLYRFQHNYDPNRKIEILLENGAIEIHIY